MGLISLPSAGKNLRNTVAAAMFLWRCSLNDISPKCTDWGQLIRSCPLSCTSTAGHGPTRCVTERVPRFGCCFCSSSPSACCFPSSSLSFVLYSISFTRHIVLLSSGFQANFSFILTKHPAAQCEILPLRNKASKPHNLSLAAIYESIIIHVLS